MIVLGRRTHQETQIRSTLHWADEGAFCWRIVTWRPKGPNKGRGAHWSAVYRERNIGRLLLAGAAGRRSNPTPVRRCSVVMVEWPAKGGRRRDLDNVIAANKFLLDALVHAGYLANDSARVVAHLGADSPDLQNRPDWCGDAEGIEIRVIPREET